MAGYKKKYDPNAPSSEDKALDVFAEMMIEKIESLSKGDAWKKPWFTEGTLQWPKNLSGREYNGMNALMLLMHCEKQGYTIPRFCTFDCVQRMNKSVKEGEEAKRVSVLKGEKSFPVMLTTFTCVDKETKAKIKYEEYKQLSEKEKEKYTVYPNLKVFRVFNTIHCVFHRNKSELKGYYKRYLSVFYTNIRYSLERLFSPILLLLVYLFCYFQNIFRIFVPIND